MDFSTLTNNELQLLDALCGIMTQYMPSKKDPDTGETFFDHRCMCAGEDAADVLEKFGITEERGNCIYVKVNFDCVDDAWRNRCIQNRNAS